MSTLDNDPTLEQDLKMKGYHLDVTDSTEDDKATRSLNVELTYLDGEPATLAKPESTDPVYVDPYGSVHPTCSVVPGFDNTKAWEATPNQIADDIERCCRDAFQNGIVHAYPAPTGSEQAKYERMWSFDQYRQVVPGAQVAQEFLKVANPRKGARVLDFGCGTGEGALMIALLGNHLKVEMLDFARNCLDQDVMAALTTQAHVLSFYHQDLSKRIERPTAEYGFNTDVMEHIPPDQVDVVLRNILQAAQHVFFQISCTDDSCGALIDDTLHLSVHEPSWWLAKFTEMKCQVHYWRNLGHACIAYVTAWATGKEIVDSGEINTEVETIRDNVVRNTAQQICIACKGSGEIDVGILGIEDCTQCGGLGHWKWQQVHPFVPNDLEVAILGGGPSLALNETEIHEMYARGVKIVTLNGAYNWALSKGMTVGAQIVVDARPFNARFTHPVNDKTRYLIGSQCDPSVLKGLPKDRTYLWHTTAEQITDILKDRYGDEWFSIVGGCTVLLRAIPLLRMLGYKRFHLFGCDSSVSPGSYNETRTEEWKTYTHHAYKQAENNDAPLFPVIVGGRNFWCTAWQIAQAQEFMDLIRILGHEFEVEVYGDGLLSWIMQHGAQLDIEHEQNAGAASKDPMGSFDL